MKWNEMMYVCIVFLNVVQPTHTSVTIHYQITNEMQAALDAFIMWCLSLVQIPCLYHSLSCLPPPCLPLFSTGLSRNSSTLYLQYSSLFPSSTLVLMSSGCGRCGVQSLSLTAAPPAGCSHGAPNASLEYWISPRTTSVLPDQQHYSFRALSLHGVSGLRQDGWALKVLCCGRR